MAGVLDIGTLLGHIDLDIGPFEEALDGADDKLNEGGAKLSTSAKLIGAGIGAAIAFSLAEAINAEAANKKLQAQLGLTAQESAKLGKTAGALYASNYGDSLEDVNDALAAVVRNVDGMSTASESELQGVTAKVLDLANAFDVDLAESTRTIGVLMKTGMAKNATEALDIITKGLQSPVNAAGDLLDTLDEYSTIFRTMGLEGDDALGILQQGLQGGARDADQVADSLKELLLRVQAGDAAGGLRAIGLDAQQMAADISAGGETAKAATDKIIDAFTGITDPADQAQVAVALFGTKSEDAQMALNNLDLSTAASDFEALNGPINGAADAMDAALGDSRAAGLETFKRKVEGAGTALGTSLLPVVDIALTSLGGLAELVGDAVQFFTDLPLPIQLTAAAAAIVAISFTSVGTAIKTAFLSNPVGIVIVGLTTALGFLIGSTDSAAEAAEKHSERVQELTGTLDENTGAITANTTASIKNSLGPEKLKALRDAGVNTKTYTDAILGNTDAQERSQQQILDSTTAAVQQSDAFMGISEALAAAGISAEDYAKALLNGDFSSINAKVDAYNDKMSAAGQSTVYAALIVDDLTASVVTQKTAFDDLNGKTAEVAEAQKEWADDARDSAVAAQGLGEFAGKAADAVQEFGGAAKVTTVDMGELAGQVEQVSEPMSEMEQAFRDADDAASDADQSVRFFSLSVQQALGINVSAREVQKALNDAVRSTGDAFDDAKEATDKNVASLITATGEIDTTTEAGSKLYDGLQDIATAYSTSTTSAYDNAIANGNSAGALQAARDAADAARGKFIEQATAAGISTDAAGLLADQLGLVEGVKINNKDFSVNAQHVDETNAELDAIQRKEIDDKFFNITATVRQKTSDNDIFTQSLLHSAQGGRVDGPGAKGVDSLHYLLAPGEFVLNDRVVDALGGFAGVEKLTQAALSGNAGTLSNSVYSADNRSTVSSTDNSRKIDIVVNTDDDPDKVRNGLSDALFRLGVA